MGVEEDGAGNARYGEQVIRVTIFAAALLVTSLTMAQSGGCMLVNGQCGSLFIGNMAESHPTHAPTGDAALDRAISICDSHMSHTPYMEGPVWEYTITGCDQVVVAWSRSKAETDRREAEQKLKDDDDRAFVAKFVKSVKP